MRASLLFLAITALLAGCSAAEIRPYTYPPDFSYITKEQIQGTMGQLAVRMVELDAIMDGREDPELEPELQARVIVLLTELHELSLDLKRGTRSNHPRIDRYAPELQRDMQLALRGARMQPPDYYSAGQVQAACEYCHVPRHLPPTPPTPPPSS